LHQDARRAVRGVAASMAACTLSALVTSHWQGQRAARTVLRIDFASHLFGVRPGFTSRIATRAPSGQFAGGGFAQA